MCLQQRSIGHEGEVFHTGKRFCERARLERGGLERFDEPGVGALLVHEGQLSAGQARHAAPDVREHRAGRSVLGVCDDEHGGLVDDEKRHLVVFQPSVVAHSAHVGKCRLAVAQPVHGEAPQALRVFGVELDAHGAEVQTAGYGLRRKFGFQRGRHLDHGVALQIQLIDVGLQRVGKLHCQQQQVVVDEGRLVVVAFGIEGTQMARMGECPNRVVLRLDVEGVYLGRRQVEQLGAQRERNGKQATQRQGGMLHGPVGVLFLWR